MRVPVCEFVCVYALRIVCTDKILRLIDILIIKCINSLDVRSSILDVRSTSLL